MNKINTTKLEYKLEGLRRMKIRKEKRNSRYIDKVNRAVDIGCPLHGLDGGSWHDSNSPTGYSQICSYRGICQSPCNGDC